MTTTRADLRAAVRLSLPDETAWPDATLDAWIAAGIRLYSAHCPRRLRTTVELTTGTQAYDLPEGTVAVVTVEYPVRSAASPRAAASIPYAAPDSARFRFGAACYTLRGLPAPDAAGDCAGQIVFAETVATGESAEIEYLGPHAIPAEDTDEITVPGPHLEALTAYCAFAAAAALETDEALTVSADTIVLSQLGESARRAWNRYRDVMDRITWLGRADLPGVPPKWERIGL